MTMRRQLLAMIITVAALAVAWPVMVQATVSECKAGIDLVQGDLDDIASGNRIGGANPQQTYNSLISKLQGATLKLDQKKNADALQKLVEFKTAVIAMRDAAKPKLSPIDAGLLLDGNDSVAIDEGIYGAIECVALLP